MGPADQHGTEVSRMVLVYTSEPFASAVEVVGDATVTLHAATTATDTDWAARLCAVDSDGRSINLQEGILRARYRHSLSDPQPVVPNRVATYTIDLGPVGARLGAGSRLRLQVSSSDFPQWDRNLNTGGPVLAEPAFKGVLATQTVLHDHEHPSHLRVPIIFDN
jgi:putative CocE/NonD family hydrolase